MTKLSELHTHRNIPIKAHLQEGLNKLDSNKLDKKRLTNLFEKLENTEMERVHDAFLKMIEYLDKAVEARNRKGYWSARKKNVEAQTRLSKIIDKISSKNLKFSKYVNKVNQQAALIESVTKVRG